MEKETLELVHEIRNTVHDILVTHPDAQWDDDLIVMLPSATLRITENKEYVHCEYRTEEPYVTRGGAERIGASVMSLTICRDDSIDTDIYRKGAKGGGFSNGRVKAENMHGFLELMLFTIESEIGHDVDQYSETHPEEDGLNFVRYVPLQ